jgi:4-amino-4-deoxy-L-arabinose transferase-like glycosyltransferase
MTRNLRQIPLWGIFWAVLIPVSLLTRSYLPIDETRYVSVAWDMWLHGNYLVPHLNGEVYSDKPPLLFWLIHLGWVFFGVNDTWPRLVSPIFGAASLFLTAKIASRLWHESSPIVRIAPLMAAGSMLWAIFMSAVMFDMLIVFFTLLGILGILRSLQDSDPKGLIVLGAAIGLGILSKGPVILLHTLPPALLAPWWAIENRPPRWFSWYAGLAAAVLMGVLIALAWAVPASIAGGEQYSRAIFWGQSAGRMVTSFAHKRPVWWYLPLLPAILFPWLLWPALWRAFRSLVQEPPSSAVRLCLAWLVPVFTIFSLISGKQPHYLLPVFPAFALISSYALDRSGKILTRDSIIPGLFIMAIGCVLLMYNHFPLPLELSRMLSGMNPYYGIILIALGPILYILYPLKNMHHTALMSVSSMFLVIVLHFSFAGIFTSYDMQDISSHISRLQKQNTAISYVGKYHGLFNFLGRLEKPLEVIQEDQVLQWAINHPEGSIIADEDHLAPEPGVRPEYECSCGRHTLKVWKSCSISAGQ